MANPEHVAKLNEGVQAWHAWRRNNPEVTPDLSRYGARREWILAGRICGRGICEK
jgi:hypothetical protein